MISFVDCLRNIGDPERAARDARAIIAEDGTDVLVEPLAGNHVEDNQNPIGPGALRRLHHHLHDDVEISRRRMRPRRADRSRRPDQGVLGGRGDGVEAEAGTRLCSVMEPSGGASSRGSSSCDALA